MNETRFRECFSQALGIPLGDVTDDLAYNSIKAWDSIGHMALVAALENAFEIMLDTDDILDMSTVARARQILAKCGVQFDAA